MSATAFFSVLLYCITALSWLCLTIAWFQLSYRFRMRLPPPVMTGVLFATITASGYIFFRSRRAKKENIVKKPPSFDSGLRLSQFFSFMLPIIQRQDPERLQNMAINALSQSSYIRAFLGIYDRSPVPENLGVDAFGLHFDNPIGLAAGFDKQGQAINGCLDLGFGFVEVGTVTPNPQSGGPKPRHFRLDADEGMVHRYEHNSWGADNVAFNIHSFLYGVDNARVPLDRRGIVGVNLGPNSHTPPPFMAEDYSRGVAKVGEYAKYLVLSVPASGSPALASPAAVDEHLRQIVRAAMAARARLPANTLMHPVDEQELAARTADMKKTPSLPALRALERLGRPPVLLKVDPDADAGVRAALAKVALEEGVDGLVVANATVSRPDTLKSVEKIQGGWLSGRPMRDLSTQAVADMYMLTQGKVPIIGVGGIFDAEDAFEKVRAGATLVQLHSALPFRGPTVARDIRDGLSLKLEQHGFKNIKDAVGVDADIWSDVPPNKR